MERKTYIYSLVCPLDGLVKYIGKANNPKDRFRKHKSLGDINKGDNIEKNKWIKSLLDNSLLPILEIIEEVNMSEWKLKEKFYIKKYKDDGYELFNICGGGNGMSFGNSGSFVGKPKRAVVCLDETGKLVNTFDSILEGRAFCGKRIYNVLVGKRKSSGGYLWLYKDKYDALSEVELKDFVLNSTTNNSSKNGNETIFKKGQKSHNIKEVHQYTLDGIYMKTWKQAKDASASIEYNCTANNITNCACGRNKSAIGYKWTYKII